MPVFARIPAFEPQRFNTGISADTLTDCAGCGGFQQARPGHLPAPHHISLGKPPAIAEAGGDNRQVRTERVDEALAR